MIPLFKPYMPELDELDNVIHKDNIACGEYTIEFEKKLSEYIGGKKKVLAVNSFDLAWSIVLSLYDIKPGDEIIVSPMACLASTQPLNSRFVKIVWADICAETGTLDPTDVARKISSKTKAIIHNHFCGYPGYIDEINAIGRKYGIPIIDDGIESFGSEYKGKKIGNCGSDATVFSFTPARLPNTIEGGAIILDDDELYEKALLLRDCGIDRKEFRDELGEINPTCDVYINGYSAKMSNVNAYIGLRQLEVLEDLLKKQREQAEKWKHRLGELQGNEIVETLTREECTPNYWVYGTFIKCFGKKDAIKYFREKGWYASGVHINNNRYSVFGKYKELSGVNKFYDSFLALPCGWWIEEYEKIGKECVITNS